MTPALELRSITVRYGDVFALRGVDLSVPAKSYFAIVGANGAGKSTLVRAVTGLVAPSSGQILLEGEKITSLTPEARARRGLGVSLEGRRLFADMSVDDNLRVSTLVLSEGSRREALEHAYELFPSLANRRRQRAGTLSGGEQQMVALGRALIQQPRVLLLDEPSLGLAPWLAEEILSQVWLLPEKGTTVVVAEQNSAVLPDRTIPACLLYQGHLVGEGTMDEVAALDAAEIQARMQDYADRESVNNPGDHP